MNSNYNHPDLSSLVQSVKKCLNDVPELVHCWRFLTGVVYALNQYYIIAKSHPSPKVDDENKYVQETVDVLTSILDNRPPKESWLRGFYYNAALMRLDAVYERLFKMYLGKDNIKGKYLYEKIKDDFGSLFPQDYYESNFGRVREEVNNLKHDEGGAIPSKREQPAVLHCALIELVAFLTDPKVTEKLASKIPRKVIIIGKGKSRN